MKKLQEGKLNTLTSSEKTTFLYGSHIPTPLNNHIIDERVENLHKNLSELLEVNLMLRDEFRITKVLEAIKFWEDFKTNEI